MLYVYQLAQITLTAQILDIQAAVCGADYEQWKPTWGCETRKLVCGCSDTWRIVGIRRLMKLCSCEEHEIIFNQRVICNRQPQENIRLVECWHACFFFYDSLSFFREHQEKPQRRFHWRQRRKVRPFLFLPYTLHFLLLPFLSQQLYSFTPVTAGQSETCRERWERGETWDRKGLEKQEDVVGDCGGGV